MKRLIFFSIILFTVSCFYSGCKEELKAPPEEEPRKIHIGFDYENFVSEAEISLKVDENIVFIRDDDEDYAIIVPNAKEFLNIEQNHLIIISDSAYEPEIYSVVDTGTGKYGIVVYCITKNEWNDADAPPRIIIDAD